MNRLIEEARKEHHQKRKRSGVSEGAEGLGDCPGESELRLQMSIVRSPDPTDSCGPCYGFSLYPPNNGNPSTGFSHSVTGTDLCFRKSLGLPGEIVCQRPSNACGLSVNWLLQKIQVRGRVIKTKEERNK